MLVFWFRLVARNSRADGFSRHGSGVQRCLVFWSSPKKRSQALLGSNLTRDIRADGAPSVQPSPGRYLPPGAVFCFAVFLTTVCASLWTPEPCLKKSNLSISHSFHGGVRSAAWCLKSPGPPAASGGGASGRSGWPRQRRRRKRACRELAVVEPASSTADRCA